MLAKLKRLLSLVARARGKPLGVISLKAAQFANLSLHNGLGWWKRYEKQAQRRWSDERVDRFVADTKVDPRQLVNAAGIEAARQFLQAERDERGNLRRFRDDVLARRVPVFDQPVELPPWDEVDWRTDWRFGHTWPDLFYRQYNFYEFDKPLAYDVKFPWELSRLNFLVIPTLLEGVEPSGQWPRVLAEALASWQVRNPFARSVNWYPMECAMRSVNLTLTALLLAHTEVRERKRPALAQLLPLCELHGRFLYRTVEYTDVRGNHFAAEIVALILLGLLLERDVPEADRWLRYGLQHLEREILLQFSDDGVQFEKSTSYHRLVTELFLLAAIAVEKSGRSIADDAKQRLRRACQYVAAYTRPDGTAPIWGDSDDARALWLDTRLHHDHRSLLALAATFFRDSALECDDATNVTGPLLLGSTPARASATAQRNHRHYFPAGGMVCYRRDGHHFVADVGSVGLNGRGGHGHLDSLSFELTLGGVPLIVDPGSFIYTGDPAARNHFRSTRAHNVAMVDRVEIGELYPRQLWQLGSEADPFDVHWRASDDGFELAARHDGYRRLADAVSYQRKWEFSAEQSRLTVRDQFDCDAAHVVERFLHFGTGLEFELDGQRLTIHGPDGVRMAVTSDSAAQLTLVDDWVSRSYGKREASKTLVLRNEIAGACCLEFTVAQLSRVTAPTSDQLALTQRLPVPTIPPLK